MARHPAHTRKTGSPAYAGIDPPPTSSSPPPCRFPRVRGDRPRDNGSNGGKGTSALDLTAPQDQALVRRCIAAGWPVTTEDLARWKTALEGALRDALTPRQKNSILKTLLSIVGQLQAAQEWQAKEARLDSDRPTENVNVREYRMEFDRRG